LARLTDCVYGKHFYSKCNKIESPHRTCAFRVGIRKNSISGFRQKHPMKYSKVCVCPPNILFPKEASKQFKILLSFCKTQNKT
jgi:hypothetical protein